MMKYFKLIFDNIVVVVVGAVGFLLYILRIKNDKIAELESEKAMQKHKTSIEIAENKVEKAKKAMASSGEKLSNLEREYYEKYGVMPDGSTPDSGNN